MSETTSFVEALRSKYCSDDDDNSEGDSSFVVQIAVSGGTKRPPLGGASASDDGRQCVSKGGHGDNSPELGYLRNIALFDRRISHAGIPPIGLSSLCPNVTDLDISCNVLSHWSEIMSILKNLPRLTFLNLSSNPLKDVKIPDTGVVFPSISELVLNDTKVSWSEMVALSHLMPNLTELYLCKNGYSSISESAENLSRCFGKVRKLALNDNCITKWEHTAKLRCLPRLENLVLMGNPLEDIHYKQTEAQDADTALADQQEGCEGGTPSEQTASADEAVSGDDVSTNNDKPLSIAQGFLNLKSVCLTDTALSKWEHLDAIGQFPNLRSVKVKNIPLLDKWNDADKRKYTVACLPTITSLNGSQISPSERDTAERSFLRYFFNHPEPPMRYNELVAQHGELEPFRNVDLRKGVTEFAKLRFIYKGVFLREKTVRLVDKVKSLKIVCSRWIDVPHGLIQLFHKELDPDTNELVLADLYLDMTPLSRFDIRDGDEIFIDERPLAANERLMKFGGGTFFVDETGYRGSIKQPIIED